MSNVNKSLKIFLSILFFLCLLDMPYGYYQFVRFGALIGFGVLAYRANEKGSKNEAILYVCLAILFQPIFKISFGRGLWNVIDTIVAVFLIVTIFISPKK